jgi:hypothetical protein
VNKPIFLSTLFIFGLLVSIQTAQAAPRSYVSTQIPRQGDTVVVKILDPKLEFDTATFRGESINFFNLNNERVAFLPIPDNLKLGAYKFTAYKNGELVMLRTMWVQSGKFPRLVFNTPPSSPVKGEDLAPALEDENKILRDLVLPCSTSTPPQPKFTLPLKVKYTVSSPFGERRATEVSEIRHLGTDFAAPKGTDIFAIASGTVKSANKGVLYGNTVVVDHGERVYSLYMHMDSMAVKEGDKISQGQKVGTLGNTGYSTAAHLHLSLKINGISVDPLRFIETYK